ncbi:MAG: hypothetical protein ACFB16_24590 [Phormidesmis sp.]
MRSLQDSKSNSADSDQTDVFLQQDDSDQPNSREVIHLVFPDGSVTVVDPHSEGGYLAF